MRIPSGGGRRVIVLEGCGRVLLFRIAFPDRDDERLWITPGGGLEPGETHEQAAPRELREETGLEGATLGPCIWTRRHIFWWIDEWVEQLERYYLLNSPGIIVKPPSPDELKKEYLQEQRWWSIAEIEAAKSETFAPQVAIGTAAAPNRRTVPCRAHRRGDLTGGSGAITLTS